MNQNQQINKTTQDLLSVSVLSEIAVSQSTTHTKPNACSERISGTIVTNKRKANYNANHNTDMKMQNTKKNEEKNYRLYVAWI